MVTKLESQIGRRLRAIMVEFDLADYEDLAKFIGLQKYNRVNNWLNGNSRPMVPEMITLCEKTGVTLDWIYRGELAPMEAELGRSVARRDAAAEHPPALFQRYKPDPKPRAASKKGGGDD